MKNFEMNKGIGRALAVVALAAIAACGKLYNLSGGMSAVVFQGVTPGESAAVRGAVSAAASVQVSVKNRDGSVAGTLSLTEARFGVREIKIKLAESAVQSDAEREENETIRYQGPYVVDLMRNTITPALDPIQLPANSYHFVEFKLDKITGEDKDASGAALVESTDPLFEKSIYLYGTYTGQTASGAVTDMPFTLTLDVDEEFKLEARGRDLAISGSEPNPILIAFRMDKWLALDNPEANDQAVDFSEVTPESGAIQLNSASADKNHKLWEVIRKALKLSAHFGRDADEDGKLGLEEADDSSL